LGLTTLEERRHQADMAQTYKIVRGKDRVCKETWFKSVTETGRATRSAADPLNLRPQQSRLEIRRQLILFSKSCGELERYSGRPQTISECEKLQKWIQNTS
jgi:hypothetical protein